MPGIMDRIADIRNWKRLMGGVVGIRGGHTPADLREIRKRKGVGRPPVQGEWDNYSRGVQADHVNQMSKGARCYGGKRDFGSGGRWPDWIFIPPASWVLNWKRQHRAFWAQGDSVPSSSHLVKSNRRRGTA